MTISRGMLMVGASLCALCVAGCNSAQKWNSTALLGSGVVNTTNGNVTSVSDAATDSVTKAKVKYDDNGTPSDISDDSIVVKVKDGDAVGPSRAYVVDTSKGTGGVLASNPGYGYVYGKPQTASVSDQSILIAGIDADGQSWSGFVGTSDLTSGEGNIAAAYGGEKPSGTMPTGAVTYTGSAAASVATTGSAASNIIGGTSSIAANFTSGAVTGTIDFTGSSNDVGFTGTMSSTKAAYTATSVTLGGSTATGQAQGGFFGPDYNVTAGAFDVQLGSTKLVGSFGGMIP